MRNCRMAKLMHNSMPKSLSLLSAEYSPAVFPASAISTSENSQGNVLSGEFFIRHTLGKSDLFDLQINYNYSDNHYHQTVRRAGSGERHHLPGT